MVSDHWELETVRLQHGPSNRPAFCHGCAERHPCPVTDLADAYDRLLAALATVQRERDEAFEKLSTSREDVRRLRQALLLIAEQGEYEAQRGELTAQGRNMWTWVGLKARAALSVSPESALGDAEKMAMAEYATENLVPDESDKEDTRRLRATLEQIAALKDLSEDFAPSARWNRGHNVALGAVREMARTALSAAPESDTCFWCNEPRPNHRRDDCNDAPRESAPAVRDAEQRVIEAAREWYRAHNETLRNYNVDTIRAVEDTQVPLWHAVKALHSTRPEPEFVDAERVVVEAARIAAYQGVCTCAPNVVCGHHQLEAALDALDSVRVSPSSIRPPLLLDLGDDEADTTVSDATERETDRLCGVLLAWEAGELSEGQACRAMGMARVTLRELRRAWVQRRIEAHARALDATRPVQNS